MAALKVAARAAMMTALLLGAPAAAEGQSTDELHRAQLERLRQEMANHLHLQAFDLVDELIYAWTQNPPFAADTPVVVADVTVPFGFGSGLEALIENHLAGLVIQHGETHVKLVLCPACRAMTVRSDAKGTVISRGIDQPGALSQIGDATASRHALFLDFEAEGSALVLRASITALTDTLPIVYARTLSSSTSSAAMLRTGDHLVSVEDARQEYLDVLQQRGPLTIPVRVSVTQFAQPAEGAGGIPPIPLIWLQSGVELSIDNTRDWTGGLIVGGAFIPSLYSGLMLQARVSRLITGTTVSLNQPNVYLFGGASLITVQGPTALLLANTTPDLATVLGAATGALTPSAIYPSFQLGLDARIGNRVGAAFFVETTPTLLTSPNIGRYVDFGLIQIQSIGGEVSLCF